MQKASKNFIADLKKQKREDRGLLFLDNVKIIKDALAKGAIQPECLLTSLSEEEFAGLGIDTTLSFRPSEYNERVEKSSEAQLCGANALRSLHVGRDDKIDDLIPIFSVDQSTIEALADTKTPQKVLCIAYHHQDVVQVPKTNFLVLDGLQDPGNVGTLIRTAKASGFEYVFLVDSVKKSNAKLIRSSVGAVFDNKVFEVTKAEFIDFAQQNKLQLICTDMNGENIFEFAEKMHKENFTTSHFDRSVSGVEKSSEARMCGADAPRCLDYARDDKEVVGVVIGNEGQGVSDEIAALCFKTVKIPMCAGIESLNAGVSGAIIMYEINKNQFKK